MSRLGSCPNHMEKMALQTGFLGMQIVSPKTHWTYTIILAHVLSSSSQSVIPRTWVHPSLNTRVTQAKQFYSPPKNQIYCVYTRRVLYTRLISYDTITNVYIYNFSSTVYNCLTHNVMLREGQRELVNSMYLKLIFINMNI